MAAKKKVAKSSPVKRISTVKEDSVPKKIIRRRNEQGEVVEIEIEDVPVQQARIKEFIETKQSMMERRKLAESHLKKVEGNSEREKRLRSTLQNAIAVIDKRLASL